MNSLSTFLHSYPRHGTPPHDQDYAHNSPSVALPPLPPRAHYSEAHHIHVAAGRTPYEHTVRILPNTWGYLLACPHLCKYFFVAGARIRVTARGNSRRLRLRPRIACGALPRATSSSMGSQTRSARPSAQKHGFAFITPGLAEAAVIEQQHLAPLTLNVWLCHLYTAGVSL